MKIDATTLDGGVTRIILTGRLDVVGADAIDLPFAAHVAGSNRGVVIDLSGVTFLASIGVRTLLTNARAVQGRGGRMVLVHARPDVARVLQVTGLDAILPVMPDLETARAAVAS